MVSIFIHGGPIMWLLLLLIVAGAAIVVDRIAALTREPRPDEVDLTDADRARAFGDFSNARLRQRLGWVLTLARLLPASGVLGSLLGAVSAFDAMAKAGEVAPYVLAAGVSEMLITATTGVLLGILMHIAHGLLSGAVDKRSLKLSERLVEAGG